MTIISEAVNKLRQLQHKLIRSGQDTSQVDEEIRKQNIKLISEGDEMAKKNEGKKSKQTKTEEKPTRMKEGGLSQRIIEVLQKNKGEMRPCEVAEKLGDVTTKKASDYLWVMAKRGQITKGEGVYKA